MSNGEMFTEIAALLADENVDLPDRVTNRMLLAAIRESYRLNDELRIKLAASEKKSSEALAMVKEHVEEGKKYPSVTWLWAHKPKSTLAGIVTAFLVLMALYTAGVISLAQGLP